MEGKPSARSPGQKPHAPHVGEAVAVGPYQVFAAGTQYSGDRQFGEIFNSPDTVLVPLAGRLPGLFGEAYGVVWAPLTDFGGVPSNWEWFLTERIIPLLRDGRTLLAFCVGSHGRTGVFLASLIALLETPEETLDPIAAVRERHCEKAVETLEQAKAIFALRGQAVPSRYVNEFASKGKLGRAALAAAVNTKEEMQ